MSNNIFDTRNIIKETPKIGNRFLLTADATTLRSIVTASPLYKLITKTSNSSLGMIFQGNGGDSGYSDVLNLSLLSATIPAFEFEAAELNHFNDTVKHLSKFSTVNDMNATYYDYINGSATAIMLAWQSMVGFKLTGEMGYKEDYVCDMDLYVYGPNRPGITPSNSAGTDSPEIEALMQYKILNAWPRSVDVGDFSYDNTEIKKVIVQFSYDIIVPVLIRSEPLAGNGLALKNFVNSTPIVAGANGASPTESNVVTGAGIVAGQTLSDDILFNIKL
jgi:hypothetical protein